MHGGEAFSQYEDFLTYLKNGSFNPLGDYSNRWHIKKNLQKALGDDWEVFRPSMPNKENAKYEEWKIWFERHFEYFRDDLVLIGYSQGAMFLARYLSENKMPMRVSKLFLLAGAATNEGLVGEDGEAFFAQDLADLKNISANISEVHIYHSEDDFVVPYENAAIFLEHIPNARFTNFKEHNHFLIEEFPEFIENIKQ